MQQAKCTNCGVEFEVDEKQEAVVCKDCKKPVVVKDAIEEYKESLEPNAPIIKNQEDLDKVNFRLKFSYYATLAVLCYVAIFLVSFISTIIIYSREGVYFGGTVGIFVALIIVFVLLSLLLLLSSFVFIIEIKNNIKYNKRKESTDFVGALKKTACITTIFVGLFSVFTIICCLLFGGVESVTTIVGLVAVMVSKCFIFKFTTDIEKLIKNT